MKDLSMLGFFLKKSKVWVGVLHSALNIFIVVCILNTLMLFSEGGSYCTCLRILLFSLSSVVSYKLSRVMFSMDGCCSCMLVYVKWVLALVFLVSSSCLIMVIGGEYWSAVFLMMTLILIICIFYSSYSNIAIAVEYLCNSKNLLPMMSINGVLDVNGGAVVPLWGEKIVGGILIIETYNTFNLDAAIEQFIFGWKMSCSPKQMYKNNSIVSMLEILDFSIMEK